MNYGLERGGWRQRECENKKINRIYGKENLETKKKPGNLPGARMHLKAVRPVVRDRSRDAVAATAAVGHVRPSASPGLGHYAAVATHLSDCTPPPALLLLLMFVVVVSVCGDRGCLTYGV